MGPTGPLLPSIVCRCCSIGSHEPMVRISDCPPPCSLRTVQLYTRDGVFLTQIAQRDSWVWCVKPRPKNNFVAIGTDDGTLSTYQLIFSTGPSVVRWSWV